MAELFKREPALLSNSPVMSVEALLGLGGGNLGALLAGHEASSSTALKAIAISDMFETADLAFARALETFE